MVNQKLRVYAEQAVQKLFIVIIRLRSLGTPGNIPHRIEAVLRQLSRIPPAHPPEIRQRPVIPQRSAVAHLIQLRDADPVLIRRHVLGRDVHGNLGKIKICSDAGGGGDAGLRQDRPDHPEGQFMGRRLIDMQVVGHIDEHLVDGIDVNILLGNEAQIDLVRLL